MYAIGRFPLLIVNTDHESGALPSQAVQRSPREVHRVHPTCCKSSRISNISRRKKAVELQPGWAKALVRLGDAYLASGQEADEANANSEGVQKAEGLVKTGTLLICPFLIISEFLTTRCHRGSTEIGFAPFEVTIPGIELLYLVNSCTNVGLS